MNPLFPARLAALSLAVFGCLFHSGCSSLGLDHSRAGRGPFFTPENHAGDPSLSGDVRRVVLLPVSGGTVASPETTTALTLEIVAALQRQVRFEIVTLSREECRRRFGVDELSSTAALPHDLFPTLRREYAADGVLFVDVTVFRGYRPLAIGLRAKLATVNDLRLVWTFDNLFSADDPAVANSARRHYLANDRRGAPVDLSAAVLQSPSRFAAYAAAAMFATLPPVIPATAVVADAPLAGGPAKTR